MNGLKQICVCGHDKDTHFEKKHNCLAVCCDCPTYWDQNDPVQVAEARKHAAAEDLKRQIQKDLERQQRRNRYRYGYYP